MTDARLSAAGAMVSATPDAAARVTLAGVMVSLIQDAPARVSAAGVMVSVQLQPARRVSAAGLMVSALVPPTSGCVTMITAVLELRRRDGVVRRWTDLRRPLVIGPHSYTPCVAPSPTALSATAEMGADTVEVDGVIVDDEITDADLAAGLWRGADWRVGLVDVLRPDLGVRWLRRGRVGEISWGGSRWNIEMRSLVDLMRQPIGRVISASCDVLALFDARCGLLRDPPAWTAAEAVAARTVRRPTAWTGHQYVADAAGATGAVEPAWPAPGGTVADGDLSWTAEWAWVQRATVVDVIDARACRLYDLTGPAADGWAPGRILWTSGANAGLAVQVRGWDPLDGRVELAEPMPVPPAPGDDCEVERLCDRSFATCRAVYRNGVNHRGFPHVPGEDAVRNPTTSDTSGSGGGRGK